jgi:hypothetical protein
MQYFHPTTINCLFTVCVSYEMLFIKDSLMPNSTNFRLKKLNPGYTVVRIQANLSNEQLGIQATNEVSSHIQCSKFWQF